MTAALFVAGVLLGMVGSLLASNYLARKRHSVSSRFSP